MLSFSFSKFLTKNLPFNQDVGHHEDEHKYSKECMWQWMVGGFGWKCGSCCWYQDQWSAALFRVDLSTIPIPYFYFLQFLFVATELYCMYNVHIIKYTISLDGIHLCLHAVEKEWLSRQTLNQVGFCANALQCIIGRKFDSTIQGIILVKWRAVVNDQREGRMDFVPTGWKVADTWGAPP